MIVEFEKSFTSVGQPIEDVKRVLLADAERRYRDERLAIEKSYLDAKLLQMALDEPSTSAAHKTARLIVDGFRRKHEPPEERPSLAELLLAEAEK